MRPAGRTLLGVRVPCRPDGGELLAEGKGACREAGSEGSRRQSAGLTDRNRIEAAALGEEAIISKAQYPYGKRRRICGRHKREGVCALPGEVCRRAEVRIGSRYCGTAGKPGGKQRRRSST